MKSIESLNKTALLFLDASRKLYPQLDALTTEIHEIENIVGDAMFHRVVSVAMPDGQIASYCKRENDWGIRIITNGVARNWEETSADDKAALGLALNALVDALTREMHEAALRRSNSAEVLLAMLGPQDRPHE